MTSPRGWIPDENLISSGRCGALDVRLLSGPDRAWVVAGLAADGVTAEETAALLSCSLRLVRQIRAEPMTVVATYAMRVRLDLERSEQARKTDARSHAFAMADATANAERYKLQRDQLLEDQAKRRKAGTI